MQWLLKKGAAWTDEMLPCRQERVMCKEWGKLSQRAPHKPGIVAGDVLMGAE